MAEKPNIDNAVDQFVAYVNALKKKADSLAKAHNEFRSAVGDLVGVAAPEMESQPKKKWWFFDPPHEDVIPSNMTNRDGIKSILKTVKGLETTIGKSSKGKTVMATLQELNDVVAQLTADVEAEADEVTVAVDALKQAVASLDEARSNPAVQDAVDKLTAAHARLSDATTRLKSGVDAATASGGNATPTV